MTTALFSDSMHSFNLVLFRVFENTDAKKEPTYNLDVLTAVTWALRERLRRLAELIQKCFENFFKSEELGTTVPYDGEKSVLNNIGRDADSHRVRSDRYRLLNLAHLEHDVLLPKKFL